MRRLTRTDAAIALLQLKTARAENKEVSEYEAARVHIDFLFDDLLKAVHAGIPRSDLVSVIMIFGEVSRRVASDTLSKRLRAAGIKEDNQSQSKSKAKAEPASPAKLISVQAAPGASMVAPARQAEVSPSTPTQVQIKEPVLAKPKVMEKPAPAAQAADIAASTDIQQPKPFSVGIKIGTGFHGVDDVGPQADREREEKLTALKTLEAMEKRLGTADKFLKQKENKDA